MKFNTLGGKKQKNYKFFPLFFGGPKRKTKFVPQKMAVITRVEKSVKHAKILLGLAFVWVSTMV